LENISFSRPWATRLGLGRPILIGLNKIKLKVTNCKNNKNKELNRN